MDFLLTLALGLVALWIFRASQQRKRIAFLAGFLSRYSIEKHIETLTQGYLRGLGEQDPERRDQVWRLLQASEQDLCREVTRLAEDVSAADAASTRVSKLPVWVPFAASFAPTFDVRDALRVHARGICQAVESDAGTSPRDRAFTISAELFLLQHTCHWFCRSKWVASARLAAMHRTSYDQVVASVLPQTRSAYLGLVAFA